MAIFIEFPGAEFGVHQQAFWKFYVEKKQVGRGEKSIIGQHSDGKIRRFKN
jgi:hypothetical protein